MRIDFSPSIELQSGLQFKEFRATFHGKWSRDEKLEIAEQNRLRRSV